MSKTYETLVDDQFGGQAQAYVASPVHAEGTDLAYVTAAAAETKGGRGLDLGCGGGHASYRLAQHLGHVTAYDLSEKMLKAVTVEAAARGLGNFSTRQGLAEHLPFEDNSFDLVVTRYSAHHWRDLDLALREARRVLKPAGRSLFIDIVPPGVPLFDTFLQSIELLRDPSHVRNYAISEWIASLTRAGFSIKKMNVLPTRIEFSSWIARMRTPGLQIQAISVLEQLASQPVRDAFAIEADGSFTMSTMVLECYDFRSSRPEI